MTKEEKRDYDKKYHATSSYKERQKVRSRNFRKNNRELLNKINKRWRLANKDKVREYYKKYRINNRLKCNLRRNEARRKKRKNKGSIGIRKGENHPNWKGGITPIHLRIRSSQQYAKWRTKIIIRDDYTCQICGKRGGKLHVDHLIQFALILQQLKFSQGIENLFEKSMVYEPLWNENNARTLCVDCHRTTDTYCRKV